MDAGAGRPPRTRVTPDAGAALRTLLDEILPTFDFGHRHAIVVDAPAARVAAAVEDHEPGRDAPLLVRVLLRLRGLPPSGGGRRLREALAHEGFSVLAERPGEEIVVGIAGRFWALAERRNLIRIADARRFRDFAEPGTARAAMSIRVAPLPDGRTRLATETRVACADGAAYRRFAPYWLLIRPFSLVIRHAMMRAIARRATAPGGVGGSTDGR